MSFGFVLGVLHQLVGWLLAPVIAALGIALLLLLWELGMALAERFWILPALIRAGKNNTDKGHKINNDDNKLAVFQRYATVRLERADVLARSGPILGLMGTLIPLGPGLTALGEGNMTILSTALAVAFDTTVVGLLVGLVAYILGRVRRRWYENCWQALAIDDVELITASENSDVARADAMPVPPIAPKNIALPQVAHAE